MIRTIVSRLAIVFVFVAIFSVGLTVSPAQAAPDTNPTLWDCVGTDNSNMTRYFRLTPVEVVNLINTDGDPSFQLDGAGDLQQTYRDGGLVTFSLALGEYTGFCFPH